MTLNDKWVSEAHGSINDLISLFFFFFFFLLLFKTEFTSGDSQESGSKFLCFQSRTVFKNNCS